jgi:ATP-binding cassette subfamily C exporter for protease/lipase
VELFEGSIADNIARFGEVDSDAVIRAARISGVHEMILRAPGLRHPPGQRRQPAVRRPGSNASPWPARCTANQPDRAGRAQRRASALGEKAWWTAAGQAPGPGRHGVLISHRPNVLAAVDKVLMLRDGTVQMLGSRDEVFAALRKASVMPAGAAAPTWPRSRLE